MGLRDWITSQNPPQAVATTATTATTATNQPDCREVSQLSQLSQGFEVEKPTNAQPAKARSGPIVQLWRGAGMGLGDLRPCSWCRNLTRGGRCLAAWRGELRAASDYSPADPTSPRRCIGFAPSPDDPDQRPGRERWPEFIERQARRPVEPRRGLGLVRAGGKQA